MEYLNNIINTILIIAIVQGFIFNVIIHYKNKPCNKAIYYLNWTIFIFTINNLQSYIVKKDIFHIPELIKYSIIDVSWNVFIAPFFFMFLIHYLKIEKHYRYVVGTTLSVFIGLVVIRLFILFSFNNQFNNSDFFNFIRRYNVYEDIFILLGTMTVFSYCVYLYYKLKDRFKYINSFNDLKWLHTFYILTAIILLLWLVAIVLDFNYTNFQTVNIYTPLRLLTSFLIYWLGYQGYNQYLLTKDRISLRTALKDDRLKPVPEEAIIDSFNEEDFKTFQKIKETITTEKLFLEPLLSLESLAKNLETYPSNLSKLINSYSNFNFTEFINNIRITYAKQLLVDTKFKNYTVIAIGLECGFNSKSTFYLAFKQFTGKTPAEFRKMKK
ncbi:MAG: helix-turn-helix domain-containing protein [Flavobacteriaceae bacterium]